MNEKQLFGVLVRAMGIFVFMEGFQVLWTASAQWILRDTPTAIYYGPVASNLMYALFVMILGGTMIRWPGWLVQLAWLERLPTIGRRDDPGPDDTRAE